MKQMRNILTGIIGLLGVAVLAACEPGNAVPEIPDERDIFYTIADDTGFSGFAGSTVHLNTEAEWETLLDRFCNYARQGEQVTFCNTGGHSSAAKGHAPKDTPTTISTTDRDALKAWMKEMEKAGRTVNVTYDDGTGTWHGRSYATIAPQNLAAEPQSYSGTITFVDTPVLDNPPLGGSVMAMQVGADTYVLTVHGMMMWFDDGASADLVELLEGSQATFTGVTGTHTDLNGDTFLSIDLDMPESGVIEF